MTTFTKVYVPCDPVCCDDYVTLVVTTKQYAIIAFPCGEEHCMGMLEFKEQYRLVTWHDKDVLKRVEREVGVTM